MTSDRKTPPPAVPPATTAPEPAEDLDTSFTRALRARLQTPLPPPAPKRAA